MRLFWEIGKLSFQRQLAYRAANWAGLATNLFFGLLRAAVITALYARRGEVQGITLQAAITYTGLTQAILAFLSLLGSYELMTSVYSGEIAADLLKPFSFYTFWLAKDFGRALVSLCMRGVIIMLAYTLLFRVTFPRSVVQWLAVVAAALMGWLISFSWRYLVNLTSFWTPDARGVGRLAFSLSWFLSGFLMPLRFFPEGFVHLCNLTPFPSMVNTIVEVYLGVLSGPALLQALITQAAWVAALVGAGQVMLRAGVRRLVIQGG